MKKGLIIGALPMAYGGKTPGGIATHIHGLVQTLTNNGYSIDLCYHKPRKPDQFAKIQVLGCGKIAYLFNVIVGFILLLLKNRKILFTIPLNSVVFASFYYRFLSNYLKTNKIDFVHVHSLSNVSPIILKQLSVNCNVIVTDHGFWQKPNLKSNKKHLSLVKKTFECSNKIIYISDYAYNYHLDYKLGDLKKMVKIPNPIDFTLFKKENDIIKTGNANKKIIFFNGLTHSLSIKRLDILLESIENDEVLKKTVMLKIVCNKNGHDFIKSKKWNFDLELFDRQPIESILKLYREANIMVLPSKSESFGLVYLEALAMGVPVIGFNKVIDEFKEQLQTYIGEAFDSNIESHLQLAQKIKHVLSRDFNRQEVQSKLQRVYSWNRQIIDFIKLYQDNITD